MRSFYAHVLLVTTGGTKKDAAVEHNAIGAKWRERSDFTEVYFDDEPDDANNDVEGFGEWTTSYELSFEAVGASEARALIEALLDAEQDWNRSGEIVTLRAED